MFTQMSPGPVAVGSALLAGRPV